MTPEPERFSFVRSGVWIPPLGFLGFSILLIVGADSVGGRVFSFALGMLSGVWLMRSLRVEVVTSDEGLTVRTSYRTTRLRWDQIDGATVAPMRSASPFNFVQRYLALSVRLVDGSAQQFDDVAASEARRAELADLVDHINRWCGRRGE